MRVITLLIVMSFSLTSWAQLDSLTLVDFQEKEARLAESGMDMLELETWEEREKATHSFIKELTSVLKMNQSFEYEFPNLPMVSIVPSPNKKFRTLTWQVETEGQLIRHYGAIQLEGDKTPLIPLVDRSDDMEKPERVLDNNKNWFGAIYYNIQSFRLKDKQAYLLYGIDLNSPFSTKKVVDILHFVKGKPVFGADIFPSVHQPDKVNRRFIMEYRGSASASLRYNNELNAIVFDNLVPVSDDQEGVYAFYVPDGTYNGLVWDKNKFAVVEDIIATNFDNIRDMRNGAEGVRKSDQIYNSKSKGLDE